MSGHDGVVHRHAVGRGAGAAPSHFKNTAKDWPAAADAHQTGAAWLDPRPADEALSVIYPPHYYSYAMADSVSPLSLYAKSLLDRRKLRGILSRTKTPSSFLDIGCGDGRYMKFMAELGLPKNRIFGLELSDQPVQKLREQGFQAHMARVENCAAIPDSSAQRRRP
jgi:SAM-dependent methyltransferase